MTSLAPDPRPRRRGVGDSGLRLPVIKRRFVPAPPRRAGASRGANAFPLGRSPLRSA